MFHTWQIFLPWTCAPLLGAKWMPGLNHALRETTTRSPPRSQEEAVSVPPFPGFPDELAGLLQKVLSPGSCFTAKAEQLFALASCPLPPALRRVGMFTFPVPRCGCRPRGWGLRAAIKARPWHAAPLAAHMRRPQHGTARHCAQRLRHGPAHRPGGKWLHLSRRWWWVISSSSFHSHMVWKTSVRSSRMRLCD